MYTFVYKNIYVCMYTYTYLQIYVCMYIYIYIDSFIYLYIPTYMGALKLPRSPHLEGLGAASSGSSSMLRSPASGFRVWGLGFRV